MLWHIIQGSIYRVFAIVFILIGFYLYMSMQYGYTNEEEGIGEKANEREITKKLFLVKIAESLIYNDKFVEKIREAVEKAMKDAVEKALQKVVELVETVAEVAEKIAEKALEELIEAEEKTTPPPSINEAALVEKIMEAIKQDI